MKKKRKPGKGFAGNRAATEERMMEKTVGKKDEALFGRNTWIFSPEDDPKEVQRIIREAYEKQEANHFGSERFAFFFKPGTYDPGIEIDMGFYTQVAGLGELPTDVKLGTFRSLARWLGRDPRNHNATCNFWRSLENLELTRDAIWAVSQATDARRLQVDGNLFLHDERGWSSGGFLSDSLVAGKVDSGSQQQWLSRNCDWVKWEGSNWNMVFVGLGEGCAPEGTWPETKFTTVEKTPISREKPFLVFDAEKGYGVYVPSIRKDSAGRAWREGQAKRPWITRAEDLPGDAGEDYILSLDLFHVAKPETDTADAMNRALAEGKNLLLTPGIYKLEKPIRTDRDHVVILGTGLATLVSSAGNALLEIGGNEDIFVGGILFDAGEIRSADLMTVGAKGKKSGKKGGVPIVLSDLFFRVGGTPTERPTQTENCLRIFSDNVVGDNFWIWRADHGSQVAWEKNYAKTGLIVDGDDVVTYALMVEHFEGYQTVWNGKGGRVYMYQSEIPYDVPSQEIWKSHEGRVNGFASFKVGDAAEDFFAAGLGVYLVNRLASVEVFSAMEVPDRPGVRVEHICTIMLTEKPGITHLVNSHGKAADHFVDLQRLLWYENGESR
ncbi:MAG: hypothetical protein IKX85_01685 [Clostridia bacterium]|nr:hypothetical protein [Clostridia bacterium]